MKIYQLYFSFTFVLHTIEWFTYTEEDRLLEKKIIIYYEEHVIPIFFIAFELFKKFPKTFVGKPCNYTYY